MTFDEHYLSDIQYFSLFISFLFLSFFIHFFILLIFLAYEATFPFSLQLEQILTFNFEFSLIYDKGHKSIMTWFSGLLHTHTKIYHGSIYFEKQV